MAVREVFMSSKRYTEAFKIEAVLQVTERGYSVADFALVDNEFSGSSGATIR